MLLVCIKAVQTYKLIESFKDPEIVPTVAITTLNSNVACYRL